MTQQLQQVLLQQAEMLPPDEMLELAEQLTHRANQRIPTTPQRRKWSELAGAAPYPLVGEDAQDWVSRERQEGQAHRDALLGNTCED